MKKGIISLIHLAILLVAHFCVWGDTIIIAGIIAIILQVALSLRFAGWVASIAYPVTYWVSSLCDAPGQGNQYVYWYLGYIGIIVLAVIIDLVVKRWSKK